MATQQPQKKTQTKKAKKTKTIEEKQKMVSEKYPKVWAAIQSLAQAIQTVEPKDVRMISGLIGKWMAEKTKAANSLKKTASKEKKAKQINDKLQAINEQKIKLEKLRKELDA